MMALSIKQPWAAAVVLGIKDVENRGWDSKSRGILLVHASKEPDFRADWVEELIHEHVHDGRFDQELAIAALTCGAIVGSVKIADCVRDSTSRWAEDGRAHWLLEQPRAFLRPVRCRGHLGFWEPPDYVRYDIESQLSGGPCL
jgi:hypothetical protein